MNYVGEIATDPLIVEVYPGVEESSFLYYDDDGISYDYEKGVYFRTRFTARNEGKVTTFSVSPADGSFPQPFKNYLIRFHLEGASKPARVHVGTEEISEASPGSATALGSWSVSHTDAETVVEVLTPLEPGASLTVGF